MAPRRSKQNESGAPRPLLRAFARAAQRIICCDPGMTTLKLGGHEPRRLSRGADKAPMFRRGSRSLGQARRGRIFRLPPRTRCATLSRNTKKTTNVQICAYATRRSSFAVALRRAALPRIERGRRCVDAPDAKQVVHRRPDTSWQADSPESVWRTAAAEPPRRIFERRCPWVKAPLTRAH